MKLVFLDKDTVTVNDELDFSGFARLGSVDFYPQLQEPEEILAALGNDCNIVVVNKATLDAELIAAFPPSLKLIAICATGFDNVDIYAAQRLGIRVANVPDYGSNAVAQLTILFLLSCANQFPRQLEYMAGHGWDRRAGLSLPMHEVAGKTLGIIGLGAIGQKVAQIAISLGMQVIAYSRSQKNIAGVTQLQLNELARQADYISLHCPLNATTTQIVNRDLLAKLKPEAYLINTARGGLVDEVALIAALEQGRLAGAALDVLSSEPPAANNPLLKMANVLVTPHMAWAPIESRQRCLDMVIKNIASFSAGEAQNCLV